MGLLCIIPGRYLEQWLAMGQRRHNSLHSTNSQAAPTEAVKAAAIETDAIEACTELQNIPIQIPSSLSP